MGDMTPTIIAKSDQLNAADLAGGPITVTVTKVDVRDAKEQPVSVHYQGDNGKPWKPCKSMCRVMVAAWGPDSKTYPGKRLTLFCDPSVKWAGMEIGGIRIEAMSHIDGPLLTAVTLAKGSRKPYRVEALAALKDEDDGSDVADLLIERANACATLDDLNTLIANKGAVSRRNWLRETNPALYDKVGEAFEARERELTPADTATDDNPTAAEGPADDDRGEATPEWVEAHDAHMARVQSATSMADLNAAISDFTVWVSDLPDDVRENVEAEERKASDRLNIAAGG